MLTPQYELFDHTADLGIRVRAASLPGLVAPSTDALYAAFGNVVTCDESVPRAFELRADEPALLLRDYLTELLHLFNHERRRLTDVSAVDFTAGHLVVGGQAHQVDAAASTFAREVKAITYHELAIRPIPGGYEATFIVDI